MRMVWNRELKKLAVCFAAFFGAGILTVSFGMRIYSDRARRDYNRMLTNVFGNVMTAYPDVTEEELVRALNGQGNEALGERILSSYGIFEEYGSVSFAVQEERLLILYVGAVTAAILWGAGCGLLFFRYLERRQRKIAGLADYMEALNRDGYKLELEDNADDELSGLRNEIYRLTVFLKEQAGRATEQKRALADSVTNISHQLKTPLTSAIVLMDNLSQNADMDGNIRKRFMEEVTRQLTGMSWLITVMLKIAKLDAGVVELLPGRLKVRELAENILRKTEIIAEWKKVSFAVRIAEDMCLYADRRWTEEAFMNIVKNAVEHSPEGGIVEIDGEENEIYTQITVRDHGRGFSREERKRLFERFYSGSSIREDSVGIGLALAREIVEKQGGRIFADSESGRGTVFTLRFFKH